MTADPDLVARVAAQLRASAAASPVTAAAPLLSLTGAARWAHLPGGGRGPVQPNPVRRLLVTVQLLIKPVCLLGFLALALYGGSKALPNLLDLPSVTPAVTGPTAPGTAP